MIDVDSARYISLTTFTDDDRSIEQVKQAVATKYGWQVSLARAADSIRARIGRGDAPVAIRLRLDQHP